MPGRRRVQTSHGPQLPRNRYVTFTLRAMAAILADATGPRHWERSGTGLAEIRLTPPGAIVVL